MTKKTWSLMSDRITHTFITGRTSSTLIIPISIARKYGFDKPTDILIEEQEKGILIRKLEI